MLKLAIQIIGISLMFILAFYLLDMRDDIDLFNFHEIVPPDIFGVPWSMIALVTVVPLYSEFEKQNKNK